MPIIARWTGFEALLLRKALRLTVDDFAALLGVSPRTVNKWESRRAQITPVPEMQSVLDTALQRADDDVHERFGHLRKDVAASEPACPGERGQPATIELVDWSQEDVGTIVEFIGSDMATRREFLELSLLTGSELVVPVRQWAAAVPLVPLDSGKVGVDEINELERAVQVFRRWDEAGQGGLHRKAVLGQLNAVVETLQHSYPGDARRRLFHVTGELAQLAGWMTWDAGLPTGAQRYFLHALDACKHAGDLDLGAKIVGDMAQLSKTLGHFDDSLAMARTALATLPRNANPLVRSELHGHEACAYARFGSAEVTNTRRSVEASLEAFEQATPDAQQSWNQYMDRAEVECLASSAYIQLAFRDPRSDRVIEHAHQAETHALNSAGARQTERMRSRLLDNLRLSKVRLAQGEPEESAVLAHGVLHQAKTIHSSLAISRLVDHSGNLVSHYGDVASVEALRADLADYVRKTARGKEEEFHA